MNMDPNPIILAKAAATTITTILASVATTSTPTTISAIETPKTLYTAIDQQLIFYSKEEQFTTRTTPTTPTTCNI
jgi:hypothetical protein